MNERKAPSIESAKRMFDDMRRMKEAERDGQALVELLCREFNCTPDTRLCDIPVQDGACGD